MHVHGYWDGADDPRARCDPPHEHLAGFLESDLQGSIGLCRETLQAIDRVASGEHATWQETGNAYTLTLSAEEARIEAEFDEQSEMCRLSLAELREAVAQWLAFLEQGRSG
ncbi:MAG: YacL family protein [Candidatus Tectomicrobia bacterium]|nr:YacL family protein [Candidatus Tectomicrobia bacterium]